MFVSIKYKGSTGSWKNIPKTNGANVRVIDCWDDIRLSDPTNASYRLSNSVDVVMPSGYPVDGQGTKQKPGGVYHQQERFEYQYRQW